MSMLTFLVVVSITTTALSLRYDGYELKFVTFVHRHGDRSPVGTYPNDPYSSESLWNNGWGQLTNFGKKHSYDFGIWLRNRYAGFLPLIYNQKDYEVQSTDVSRTLMSAYLVLAGLYTPLGSDMWNSDIKWQPIPVHTTPRDMDNILAATKPCPRHVQLLVKLLFSEEIQKYMTTWAPMLDQVAVYAGYNTTSPLVNFFLAGSVYDSLFVQNLNGYVLPQWTALYFPQPLQDVSSLILKLATYNRPLQRLSCGLLVKDILTHFKLKSLGLLKKKIWQYSAHDVTIVGLRQCLNLNETDSPYASALILELHSQGNEYYVRVLYKTLGENIKTLVLSGCSENCPLQVFEELMSPIIPKDWAAECLPKV